MNVVVANKYYFSLYYRENTGCLQCKSMVMSTDCSAALS